MLERLLSHLTRLIDPLDIRRNPNQPIYKYVVEIATSTIELEHTCCLKSIFSCWFFLVKLDKSDKGKTKAALPTKTIPNNIALTSTDVPGLPNQKHPPTC